MRIKRYKRVKRHPDDPDPCETAVDLETAATDADTDDQHEQHSDQAVSAAFASDADGDVDCSEKAEVVEPSLPTEEQITADNSHTHEQLEEADSAEHHAKFQALAEADETAAAWLHRSDTVDTAAAQFDQFGTVPDDCATIETMLTTDAVGGNRLVAFNESFENDSHEQHPSSDLLMLDSSYSGAPNDTVRSDRQTSQAQRHLAGLFADETSLALLDQQQHFDGPTEAGTVYDADAVGPLKQHPALSQTGSLWLKFERCVSFLQMLWLMLQVPGNQWPSAFRGFWHWSAASTLFIRR